jgi:Tol biopolymer transport system component/DNA-binding winged helix-turn-helix (wHTH) protein
MAETGRQLRLLRFGDFEVDLRSGELRKAGGKLKFGGQPFQVLTILLEHSGEVVTREELQKRLWPDTFVDVDHNLNTAINKIREVLGDSAERPRFVETLPRRGYRFIGQLEPPVLPAEKLVSAPAVNVEPDRSSTSRRRWLKMATALSAIFVLVLAAVTTYRWGREQRPQQQEALTAVPFTALPGQATSPAFSPDASRIAFTWNGDPKVEDKGFDLYVKAMGSETLLRLTQHPSQSISPAWSPDGTQIAFHRLDGADTGIYVVPALGGPERKLRATRMPGGDFVSLNFGVISWSPDGKWIAFADEAPEKESERLSLLSTETFEATQMPVNPTCIGEGLPAFSHNGEYLAYWCVRGGYDSVLYSLPIRGGQPKTISSFQAFPYGLTWSADDKKLIYSLSSLGSGLSHELGEVTVENGSTKKLAFAGSAILPSVSFTGDKLAYSSLSTSMNLRRRDLLHPETPAVELIPSSRGQFNAQYSPDGKRIAFASPRTGLQGVWISSDDGTNLVQISNPNYVSGSPQWSPDGNQVAFDSHPGEHWEIFVAGVAERKPRKLVTNITNLTRPHWSSDGKWIYFRSEEPGRTGVYRCPASGGDAIAIAKDINGINPRESFDGKTVYFASNHDRSTLKQVALPAQPGTESKVDGMPRIRAAEFWALSRTGIYFVPAEAPSSLRYFDFATRQIRLIFEMDKDFSDGLSISPDGRWILYSQNTDISGDIMLVDHFQ